MGFMRPRRCATGGAAARSLSAPPPVPHFFHLFDLPASPAAMLPHSRASLPPLQPGEAWAVWAGRAPAGLGSPPEPWPRLAGRPAALEKVQPPDRAFTASPRSHTLPRPPAGLPGSLLHEELPPITPLAVSHRRLGTVRGGTARGGTVPPPLSITLTLPPTPSSPPPLDLLHAPPIAGVQRRPFFPARPRRCRWRQRRPRSRRLPSRGRRPPRRQR